MYRHHHLGYSFLSAVDGCEIHLTHRFASMVEKAMVRWYLLENPHSRVS